MEEREYIFLLVSKDDLKARRHLHLYLLKNRVFCVWKASYLHDLPFSQRCWSRFPSSGTWCRADLYIGSTVYEKLAWTAIKMGQQAEKKSILLLLLWTDLVLSSRCLVTLLILLRVFFLVAEISITVLETTYQSIHRYSYKGLFALRKSSKASSVPLSKMCGALSQILHGVELMQKDNFTFHLDLVFSFSQWRNRQVWALRKCQFYKLSVRTYCALCILQTLVIYANVVRYSALHWGLVLSLSFPMHIDRVSWP